MTSKDSRLLLIISALATLVFLAVIIFGIYNIRIKNEETSKLINETGQITKTENIARLIKTLKDNAAGDLEIFENLVFTNDKLVPLIENIEQIGQDLDLDVKIVSVGKTDSKDSTEPSLVRLTAEARGSSWNPVFAFLRAIESLPYRVMIGETSLLKMENDWRLEIVLSIHSFD